MKAVTAAVALLAAGAAAWAAAPGSEPAAASERVIQVTAQRFTFTPSEIVVRRGEAVVLELTALDFVHGFNIPSLKLRADLPPNQTRRIRFTPGEVGEHPFVCDNFCGSGHEDMHGRIVVKG